MDTVKDREDPRNDGCKVSLGVADQCRSGAMRRVSKYYYCLGSCYCDFSSLWRDCLDKRSPCESHSGPGFQVQFSRWAGFCAWKRVMALRPIWCAATTNSRLRDPGARWSPFSKIGAFQTYSACNCADRESNDYKMARNTPLSGGGGAVFE
jgi:hypothetical protein